MIALALPFIERARRLVHFAGASFVDQAIVSGLNFFVAIYLARSLGMESFGQFSLVLIFTFFCIEIQRSVIVSPMMTLAAHRNDPGNYFLDLSRIQIAGALICAVTAGIIIALSDTFFPKWAIAPFYIPSAIFVFFRLIQEYQRRLLFLVKMEKIALIADSVMAIIIVALLLVLGFYQVLNVGNILWVHALASCVSFLISYFGHHHIPQKNTHTTTIVNIVHEHWRFGRWLMAAVVMTYASSNYFILSGGAKLGSESTGIIKTAQYIMGGITVLLQAIENIIPFRLSKIVHTGTRRDVNRFSLHVVGVLAFFWLVYSILVLSFIEPITHWLGVKQIDQMVPVIVVNIILSFILVINTMLQYLLRALYLTQAIFWANAVTAIISIASAPFVISHFGVFGIVYGLVCLQLVTMVVYATYLIRNYWGHAS